MGLLDTFRKKSTHFGTNPVHGIQTIIFTGDSQTPGFSIELDSFSGLLESYEKCSPVSTVIGRLAAAMANGKWWIVDKNDNDVKEREKRTSDILRNPNPLQSWSEMIIQAETMRYVYGEVFFYLSVPVGYRNDAASAIWVINPKDIEIDSTGKKYDQYSAGGITGKYILYTDGRKREIEQERILHIRDAYQNLNAGPGEMRGKSRLLSLRYEIRNIIQAQEAIYSLNKDRGAQGILVNKNRDESGNIPLRKSEKEDLQRQFHSYGLKEEDNKVIITNSDLQWQQISYNVRDLMLFEGIKSNIENIADAFAYPFELLANSKGSTFANKAEAEKIMYQDVIIPFSKIYAEKFTSFLHLENAETVIDFSGVECMKESGKEDSDALHSRNRANEVAYRNGIITVNEWRQSIEMDEIAGGDRYNETGKPQAGQNGRPRGKEPASVG
jgi:HK97 family phage portal protein